MNERADPDPSPTCPQCGRAFTESDPRDIPCPACGTVRPRLVGAADLLMVGLEPEVWIAASFAQAWFEDALREARTGPDAHARRREIVFAVCFMESYLVEWVRDIVGPKQIAAYFPLDDRRGIRDRWKEVLKQLEKEKLIAQAPNFLLPYWEAFLRLIAYRDGLVHALASRPSSSAAPPKAKPIPPMEALGNMPPGWAVGVVVDVVRQLHQAANTPPPSWLVKQ